MILILIIYAVVAAILYIIGYWFCCKSYIKYRDKWNLSFREYYDDQCGWFLVPAFGWPVLIFFFPLLLLVYICFRITRKIKKHFKIVN